MKQPSFGLYFSFFLTTIVSFNCQGFVENKADTIQDRQSVFAESLKAGRMFLGIGANIFTDVTKNEDQFTSYIIDEKDRRFNMKLSYGYFIRDTHPVGVGFKYYTNELNSVYQNLLLDTINYHEKNNDFTTNFFYGVTKQLFNSKRIYFISDPSLFLTFGNTTTEREIGNDEDISKANRLSIAAGLNIGVLVFLWPNMAATVQVGPVGIGYKWEDYTLNDETNGGDNSFFIRMSPDLLSLQFTIARYF